MNRSDFYQLALQSVTVFPKQVLYLHEVSGVHLLPSRSRAHAGCLCCWCLQISGGHKYLPPRQDVNAPDLYIPLMGAGTYCLLICLAAAQRRKFKPELMTAAVSTTFAAWTAHTVLLKVLTAAPPPAEHCPDANKAPICGALLQSMQQLVCRHQGVSDKRGWLPPLPVCQHHIIHGHASCCRRCYT